MVKVSLLYGYAEGCRFEMDYFCKEHIPMVRDRFGDACKGIAVDQGLAGDEPGSPPAYVAMAHFFFDSVEAFQNAFAPHAEIILADVPDYTDAEMTIQISQVRINATRSETGDLHLHMV
jgi:uncharacterized protein (TIGR02118 family)